MPVINRIAAIHDEMTAWRRDIHAHPELGFEEERTASVVAEKLESFGIQVHRGLAKTGVVGVLEGAPGARRHRAPRGHGRAADPRGERRRLPLDQRRHHARLRP